MGAAVEQGAEKEHIVCSTTTTKSPGCSFATPQKQHCLETHKPGEVPCSIELLLLLQASR